MASLYHLRLIDILQVVHLISGILSFGGNSKENITNLSMESTNEIFSRLKFLGHIQKGDKISVKNLYFQPDGWTTRFSRLFIYPDNRNNTLKFIKEVINRTFEILNAAKDTTNQLFLAKTIIQDLNKAEQGLINLKTT